MKKVFLSIVILVNFYPVNAQTKNKGTFEITPKIGYSSFIEHNENNSNDNNSGVELGVTTDYYFNNSWSLRSGLIFDKMGGLNISGNGTHSYEDKLSYLCVPINANWHFGSTRKWNLNLGLSPSFLISAKYIEYNVINNISKDDIKPFQLGLTYGIGYKIKITKKFGILFDSQFFKGLTNVSNTSNFSYTNSGYSLNIGGVIQL
ncbi:porin family protein [Flavobacterium sp.]|uniref:porin family protein n=1 Tax=Flavobacterium sp. TaxID=239 RepID=UPI0038FC79C2